MAAAYAPLRLSRALGLRSPDRLRVLLYHDVPREEQEHFAAQLRWLQRSWTFVSAERFVAMMDGREAIRGANLLLTFDDGFHSNRVVAEEVLRPMGIPALFFVVPDFIEIDQRDAARRYVASRIRPGVDLSRVPEHLGNMQWPDLEALLDQGHTIGHHTLTHARLSDVPDPGELTREIVDSADRLSARLGAPVDHFAFPFGDVASCSPQALAIARGRFPWVHSGVRGNNVPQGDRGIVWRDAVVPTCSRSLLGAFLEGVVDPAYARSRTILERWGTC
jgi:peptidoglycan/xylan/chitin deacetylase (PgdA/CDA1 family)